MELNIKNDLQEVTCDDVAWIHLPPDRKALVSSVLNILMTVSSNIGFRLTLQHGVGHRGHLYDPDLIYLCLCSRDV
jgi:hypothetical protein